MLSGVRPIHPEIVGWSTAPRGQVINREVSGNSPKKLVSRPARAGKGQNHHVGGISMPALPVRAHEPRIMQDYRMAALPFRHPAGAPILPRHSSQCDLSSQARLGGAMNFIHRAINWAKLDDFSTLEPSIRL